jgi:hypothetical protein
VVTVIKSPSNTIFWCYICQSLANIFSKISHISRILTHSFLQLRVVLILTNKGRCSSVGIATGYGLDDRGSGVRFPVGAENSSLLHRVQTGSGALQLSCRVGKNLDIRDDNFRVSGRTPSQVLPFTHTFKHRKRLQVKEK